MNPTTSELMERLVEITLDLTASLTAEDRYRRLVDAARHVLPCDSVALLRLEGDALVPVATHGLAPEVMGRRFLRQEHPRLDIILRSDAPTLFPPDTSLPDPFDGMLLGDLHALHDIHACLGCPLRVEGEVVGVLAADALDPHAFDHVPPRLLRALGALAGAAMRTSDLIAALEREAAHQKRVVSDLMQDAERTRGGHLIGRSPVMDRLRAEIELVARSDFTVLLTGETGTGKELVARALHAASGRRDHPLIYVNCAALPEAVAESELFGHVRGSFTGAERDRSGKFEVADGGTLFLDEIGELPLPVQPKLLRVLQEGEIQRVGSDRPLHVDVRVIAASNRDLPAEVKASRFRSDLYHRLNVYRIHAPPLRERLDDVPVLAGWFCDMAGRRLGLGAVRISQDARAALGRYPWPGNVRELENVVSRAVLRASAGTPRGSPVICETRHLGRDFTEPAEGPVSEAVGAGGGDVSDGTPLREATEAFQRRVIRDAVERSAGNWAAAARSLGMHRSNLHHLAGRLGLR